MKQKVHLEIRCTNFLNSAFTMVEVKRNFTISEAMKHLFWHFLRNPLEKKGTFHLNSKRGCVLLLVLCSFLRNVSFYCKVSAYVSSLTLSFICRNFTSMTQTCVYLLQRTAKWKKRNFISIHSTADVGVVHWVDGKVVTVASNYLTYEPN